MFVAENWSNDEKIPNVIRIYDLDAWSKIYQQWIDTFTLCQFILFFKGNCNSWNGKSWGFPSGKPNFQIFYEDVFQILLLVEKSSKTVFYEIQSINNFPNVFTISII